MDKALLVKTAKRLTDVRACIVSRQHFFGRLLMRLSFGFAPCSTACTDMKRIVFDPDFADRLNDGELEFVMLHELMHCVLKHCTRGKGMMHSVYNIACDIVVNSTIMEAMGLTEFKVDGSPVMHLAPDGKEGRLYTAEQVYHMLMKKTEEDLKEMIKDGFCDNHEEWQETASDKVLEEIWNRHIVKAAEDCNAAGNLPAGIQRIVDTAGRRQKVDWRQVLRDYIQFDSKDYTFMQPDRRLEGNVFLPSFQTDGEGRIEKLWFAVDTSGSVSEEALSEAMFEIKDAIAQVGSIEGSLSFFDAEITEPIPFDSVEQVAKALPVGGGGTSFKAVFEELPVYFKEGLPKAVIIMTDGYADFPDESSALGVNVIWLIIDSEITPPFGETVRINTI